MVCYNTFLRNGAWKSASCMLFFLAGPAAAAPAIQQVSGTLNHKSAVTITGSGFGTKPTAAPAVWDDASTGNYPTDNGKWSGYWPHVSEPTTYYMRYTTPIRGIALPHSHITRYLAGGHGGSGDSQVNVRKDYTISSYPHYVYISYYYRVDSAWNFCSGDNNFKIGSHSLSGGSYKEPYWYYEHRNGDLTGPSGNPGIYTPYIPSSGGGSHNFGSGANPAANWVKLELEIAYANASSGYVKLWNNGTLKAQYNGPTDGGGLGGKSESIGGYARCYGSGMGNNWRYFADLYLDSSRARIVLANNADLSSATIVEPQIPSSWSSTSISASVNLGKFSTGQTAYMFVLDSSGQRNASGFPVTVGGTGGAALNPPTNLRIQ